MPTKNKSEITFMIIDDEAFKEYHDALVNDANKMLWDKLRIPTSMINTLEFGGKYPPPARPFTFK